MGWKFEPNRIVMAREARDFTQAQLAERIGATPQQLSQWELGNTIPGQESLTKICNALGCPPKFFYVHVDDDNHQNEAA